MYKRACTNGGLRRYPEHWCNAQEYSPQNGS